MDCSLPGPSVHGILQARRLEWVAMPSSRDLPHPGIDPSSLLSYALKGRFLTTSATWEAQKHSVRSVNFCARKFTWKRRDWFVFCRGSVRTEGLGASVMITERIHRYCLPYKKPDPGSYKKPTNRETLIENLESRLRSNWGKK